MTKRTTAAPWAIPMAVGVAFVGCSTTDPSTTSPADSSTADGGVVGSSAEDGGGSRDGGADAPVQDGATADGSTSASFTDPEDRLDTSRWQASNWANGGMFASAFLPDHVGYASGIMTLTLDDTPSSGDRYSGAEIQSVPAFSYGTFATRMKAARYSGTVSSFFLYTSTPVWDEIDVEILGKDPTKVQFNYFVNGVGGHEHVHELGFDSSASFHLFKIEYGAGYIKWYVDDALAYEVNGATGTNIAPGGLVPSHPMKLMVNLWAGQNVDSWLGPFTYTGPAHASYDSMTVPVP